MSFSKIITCKLCDKHVKISEEKFPEELFDLIIQYNSDQLYWICKSCHLQKIGISSNLNALTDEVRLNSLEIKNINEKLSAIYDILQSALHPKRHVKEADNFNSFEDSSDSYDGYIENNYSSSSSKSTPTSFNQSTFRSPGNKGAHKILTTILNGIKPGVDEEKECHEIVEKFMKFLIEELKKDDEFNYLYGKLYYTGSSYNDLRISSATEYDIDIILKCPPKISFKVEFVHENLAFAKIKWKPLETYSDHKIISKFSESIEDCNYLIPSKINSWFQSKLDKCDLKSFNFCDKISDIKTVQSGPSRTVKIYTDSGKCIDLDLVPVFCFKYDIFLESSDDSSKTNISEMLKNYPIQCPENEICLFVPKPLKRGNKLLNITPQDKSIWRLDLPEIEKVVLKKKACAKPIIKLTKLLRDNMDWKALASYYLKTVVLIMIRENPDDDNWNQNFLYERFMEALKQLRDYMDKGEIPCFFSCSYNLINQLNQDQCTNWKNKLNNIIQNIESDYNSLNQYLKH